LFLFCPRKTEDEKTGLILVDKFMVRFANREPIPMEHNMSIKDCVRKHLPSSITVMMSQTSFGHISTDSSTIPTVLMPA